MDQLVEKVLAPAGPKQELFPPKEEKKPQMELQKKLEGEGWKVRKVQNYNGCYEVYGFDGAGKRLVSFLAHLGGLLLLGALVLALLPFDALLVVADGLGEIEAGHVSSPPG